MNERIKNIVKMNENDGYFEKVNDEEYLVSCPCCGKLPISNFDNYCRHCGQAIEFADEEKE